MMCKFMGNCISRDHAGKERTKTGQVFFLLQEKTTLIIEFYNFALHNKSPLQNACSDFHSFPFLGEIMPAEWAQVGCRKDGTTYSSK